MDCAMSAYRGSSATQNQQLTQNQRRFVSCPDTKTALSSSSPDFAGFGTDHGLACFTTESLLELRQIRDDAVDAVFAGRVRIGNGADVEVLRALAFAGPLAHADEEALVGGEAVFIFKTHSEIGR